MWPDKASLLEPFHEQTHSIAAPPQDFQKVAAFAAEDKDMSTEWVMFKNGLNLCSKAVEAGSHVGHARS
jgi:hypothetical protein